MKRVQPKYGAERDNTQMKREKRNCFRVSMSKIRKMAVKADPTVDLFCKWQYHGH